MNIEKQSFCEIGIHCAIIFLASLFFIIAVTAPGLQINDEWITTNQLHQLSQGHQIVTNEGKYGTVLGETISYFSYRHNILGYSLFLPFTAIIPLFLIRILGDNFRLFILLFWISIPVIITYLYQIQYPSKSAWKGIPLIIFASIGSLMLLLINLLLYHPFSSSFKDAPIESAALVFSAHIQFSILVMILYIIGLYLYTKTKIALLCPIIIISCSSLIFWASNAKDHMLTALLISLVLLFFIIYSNNLYKKNATFGFLFCGLLMWVRPEIGFTLLVVITLWFLLIENEKKLHRPFNLKKKIIVILTPLWFFIGAIPFLVNNYLLTENPLYPVFLQYEPSLTHQGVQEISNIDTNTIISNITPASMHSSFDIGRIFYVITKYYSINSQDFLTDIGKNFFFTDTGSIGIFAVNPLLLIALLTIPAILVSRWEKISATDKRVILLCILSIIAIFLSYLRSFQDMPLSEGVGPDIRYYSAIYIPGGLLGIISMKYWPINPLEIVNWQDFLKVLIVVTPLFIIFLLIAQPFGGGYTGFTFFLSLISLSLAILITFQFMGMESGYSNNFFLRFTFLSMILIPFTWQIILVFLFSIAKFDGYPFWIPITEAIFNGFIIPVQ